MQENNNKLIASNSVMVINSVVAISKDNNSYFTSDNSNMDADNLNDFTDTTCSQSSISTNQKANKSSLINKLFSCVAIILGLLLLYTSFSVDKIKTTFSQLKPGFPSIPSKNIESKAKKESVVASSVASWKRVDSLLASTEQRRARLFKELMINKGDYILACLSTKCGDCDRLALELNQKPKLDHIIAITNASLADVEEWKKHLGLKFRVESVPQELFDDSGVVLLPTIIKVKNGKAIGASEFASVVE